MAKTEENTKAVHNFRVLEALHHKGPLPVNTIGPKVELTPGSISLAVDRLEARGLVTKKLDPDDRRIHTVYLTAKGETGPSRARDGTLAERLIEARVPHSAKIAQKARRIGATRTCKPAARPPKE